MNLRRPCRETHEGQVGLHVHREPQGPEMPRPLRGRLPGGWPAALAPPPDLRGLVAWQRPQ